MALEIYLNFVADVTELIGIFAVLHVGGTWLFGLLHAMGGQFSPVNKHETKQTLSQPRQALCKVIMFYKYRRFKLPSVVEGESPKTRRKK